MLVLQMGVIGPLPPTQKVINRKNLVQKKNLIGKKVKALTWLKHLSSVQGITVKGICGLKLL